MPAAIDPIPQSEQSRGEQNLLYTILQHIRPARATKTVTPSSDTLPANRAIWVGGAGNLSLTYEDGTTDTIVGVMAGTLLPFGCAKITAATATPISIVLL